MGRAVYVVLALVCLGVLVVTYTSCDRFTPDVPVSATVVLYKDMGGNVAASRQIDDADELRRLTRFFVDLDRQPWSMTLSRGLWMRQAEITFLRKSGAIQTIRVGSNFQSWRDPNANRGDGSVQPGFETYLCELLELEEQTPQPTS